MLRTLIVACVSAICISSGAYAAGDLEFEYNRIGGDYKDFDLPMANPMMCKEACAGEPKCKAMVYVGMGNSRYPNQHCWLKSSVPNATPDTGVISWVKNN